MRRRRVARAAVGTAVIAGTAGAVHHHQDKKYAQQDYEQQMAYQQAYEQGAYDQQQEYEQEQYEQQYAPPPPEQAAGSDLTAQLQQLAQLHEQGILSDEEFAAAKSKLLAG